MIVSIQPLESLDAMARRHLVAAARKSALPDDHFIEDHAAGQVKLFRGQVANEDCVTFALEGIGDTLWLAAMGGEGPAWTNRARFLDALETLAKRSGFEAFGWVTMRPAIEQLGRERGMSAAPIGERMELEKAI